MSCVLLIYSYSQCHTYFSDICVTFDQFERLSKTKCSASDSSCFTVFVRLSGKICDILAGKRHSLNIWKYLYRLLDSRLDIYGP